MFTGKTGKVGKDKEVRVFRFPTVKNFPVFPVFL
jgi:hypothetical protein